MKIRLLYIISSIIAIALLIYSSFPKNIKSDTFVRGISFIYVVNYDYVAHSTMGLGKDEFFIDFKNRLIYKFQIEYSHYYILHDGRCERNPNSIYEGYHCVSALSKEKIDKFLNIVKWSNFLEWKPSYIESNETYNDELSFDEHGHPTYIPEVTLRGLQWFILIGYKDGTYKEIRGQNKYPPDWNTMFFAFEDMTVTPILGAKLEWEEVFYERFKAMIAN